MILARCNFIYSLNAQLHILRHFDVLNTDYIDSLQNQFGISNNFIFDQLKMKGSKFYVDFANNPIALWSLIKQKIKNSNFTCLTNHNQEKLEVSIMFEKELFATGIGTDMIIDIKELTEDEKENIVLLNRDSNQIVKTIVRPIQNTWQANVILRKVKNEYDVISIFPGILAPPFPNADYISDEEIVKSTIFWNNHIFIIPEETK